MAIKTEEIALPSLVSASEKDYRVRYMKACLDDPVSITELEIVETKGIKGDDVVIINKDKFTFMDKYYIVVTYLEKISD